MAVVSIAGPMAVLSRQKQPNGQTSDLSCKFCIIPHNQFISDRAKLFSAEAGPVAVVSRPTCQLTKSGSIAVLSLIANDLATNCNFGIIPRNQFISGRAKLFSSKSLPNGRFINARSNSRFINARPNGSFITAEAIGWPDLQISAANCNFAIIPHNQFISGRAKLFSSKSLPNGRFINAVLSTPGPMAVLTTGKLFSAKACPMAVLSTRGPMAVLSTRGPIAVLSTPGPMAVLSRQRQRMARPPDFSNKLKFRYYPAHFHGRFINARPNGRFIKAEATKWPDLQILATSCNFAIIPRNQFINGRAKLFSTEAGPVAVLSRPACRLTKRGSIAVLSLAASFIAPNDRSIKANSRFIKPRQPVDHFNARRLPSQGSP